MNNLFEEMALLELKKWQKKMLRKPSLLGHISKRMQTKMNSWIPEKIHKAITVTIKQMIKAVLFGARYATSKPLINVDLLQRENLVRKKIELYKKLRLLKAELRAQAASCLVLLIFRF